LKNVPVRDRRDVIGVENFSIFIFVHHRSPFNLH
jgi:hypothetical protein